MSGFVAVQVGCTPCPRGRCCFEAAFCEDAGTAIFARLTTVDDTLAGDETGVRGEGYWLTQADLDSIGVTVTDLYSRAAVYTASVTIGDAVFDTPVSDSVWLIDSVGYNFRHQLPATVFAASDRAYAVEYRVETTSGHVYRSCIRGCCGPVYGS